MRPDRYAKIHRRLAALVLSKFQLDPYQPALFLFCGRRKDRIKGLLWDETGFLLLYERLSISQPKAIQKVTPAYSF
ncbi:IS66 family insertion sequence element accessory protein TnpB [Selenomonas ruminantium]|uniref:IS66 family insertion sequence element accessory protein TnpB n=1 Tax=Selenomonas ruminantium TaxID=971 RepID=UPI0009EA5F5A